METLRTSGRLMSLWRQINGLHDDLISTYHVWMPILQLRYWKYQPSSLRDLMVSDKRFEELKPLYLTAFELFARLSVIGMGVALIRGNGNTDLPTAAWRTIHRGRTISSRASSAASKGSPCRTSQDQ